MKVRKPLLFMYPINIGIDIDISDISGPELLGIDSKPNFVASPTPNSNVCTDE